MSENMKSIVITGSARGLGYELAKAMIPYGYGVCLSDINEALLTEAKKSLEGLFPEAKIVAKAANVAKKEDLEALYLETEKEFGKVSVFVNNAGVNQRMVPLYELEEKEIDLLLDVDLKGAMMGSLIAFKKMKEQGFGQIYTIDGFGSNDAFRMGLNAYGTSKRALTHFSHALAKESEELGAKVLIGRLSPGIMITNFVTHANEDKTTMELPEKVKKVYNILGDYPDVVATFFAKKIASNSKNDVSFEWLTGAKAFHRFLHAKKYASRDFFGDNK